MKKMTLPVAVFVAILGCVLAVSANVNTMQIHDKLKMERYHRIQAENQMQNLQQEMAFIKKQAAQSLDDLARIQSILSNYDTEKTTLRQELQQMSQERDKLLNKVKQLSNEEPSAPTPPPSTTE